METATSAFSFLSVAVALVCVFLMVMEWTETQFTNDLWVLIGIVAFLFVLHQLWWTFVAKLREPSQFG